MSAVTKYTDTSRIRAAIGITDKDMSDKSMTDINLDDRLLSELAEWLPTHATVYTDGTAGTPTAVQLTDYRNLKLYSNYYCASCLDLRLAVVSTIGDGKNIMKRFEGVDFDELSAKMTDQAAIYRKRLELSINATAEQALGLIGLSVPTYDPVVGDA
jgi:hypothetical protein